MCDAEIENLQEAMDNATSEEERREAVLRFAKFERDRNREIYDRLARE